MNESTQSNGSAAFGEYRELARRLSGQRVDRRRLLQLGATLGGAAVVGPYLVSSCSAPTPPSARGKAGLVIGPGRKANDVGEQTYHLSIVDLDSGDRTPRQIALDFFAHGVSPDPTNPKRACLFEKRGPGACEIDLEAGQVLRPIRSPENREFYGHGAFLPDGSLVYATESLIDEDYRGVVVVRDGKTLQELGEFPTSGASPHDCTLRDGGKTLVVTNGGSQKPGGQVASVTYVDVETEKLIEEVRIDSPAFNAGHLAISAAGDLAVVSAARDWMPRESLGAASFRPSGGVFRTMGDPFETTQRMLGESLSVAIHEPTGVVGITNPKGHLVTFWNLKQCRLVSELRLAEPRGIAVTLDESRFVVSYGGETSLLLVDPDMGGSHVIVHELA
jgi:hypothetical protein